MYFCSSASDGAPAEDDGLSSAWSDAGDTVWDRLADGVWSEISAPRAPPADARERAYASFSSFSAPPPGSVLEALGAWARTQPSKALFTWVEGSAAEPRHALRYGEVAATVRRLAADLVRDAHGLGLRRRERALLVFEPGLQFILVFLACLHAGVVAVPCYPPDPRRLRKDVELFAAAARASGAEVAFTSRSYDHAKSSANACLLYTSPSPRD